MITLNKRVIRWGNSAGVYIPRRYIGRDVSIQILERPKLSTSYIYGITISMECYGYNLIKPENFKPELYSEKELKGYSLYNYGEEDIKIMLMEDIILESLLKKQDFRLIMGIPIILFNYKKNIDFGYLIENLEKEKKTEFLGYILDITLNILKKFDLRLDLQKELKMTLGIMRIKKNEVKGRMPFSL